MLIDASAAAEPTTTDQAFGLEFAIIMTSVARKATTGLWNRDTRKPLEWSVLILVKLVGLGGWTYGVWYVFYNYVTRRFL